MFISYSFYPLFLADLLSTSISVDKISFISLVGVLSIKVKIIPLLCYDLPLGGYDILKLRVMIDPIRESQTSISYSLQTREPEVLVG